MTCKLVDLGNGTTAVVCYRGRRLEPCSVPGCPSVGSKLCDHPVTRKGVEGTCDMKICGKHATAVGPDRDLCPAHSKLKAPIQPSQPRLPGMK